MEVTYDSQTFLRQRVGGISKYFADLIQAFDAHPELGVHPEVNFAATNNLHLEQSLEHRGIVTPPSWVPRVALYIPAWLRGDQTSLNSDLVHYTYYSSRFLGHTATAKRAVTIYDMIPEIFKGEPGFTGSHLAKRKYVDSCDLVICISESTKNDMLNAYGGISAEIRVIPLGVSSRFSPTDKTLTGWPSEYILYVGARKGYKDFEVLLRSLVELHNRGLYETLMVVGSPFTRHEIKLIKTLGLSEYVRQHALPDSQLVSAYSNATAFVQTSRYEGFGLPPLEAMACGAPTIIANAASMPEVGADVAVYFEPGEYLDLAIQLEKILTDSDLRSRLKAQGPIHAKRFSVERMARDTAEAYASVL